MFTHRNRWMAALAAASLLLGAAVAFADEPAAEAEEEDDSVPAGVSYALDATLSSHHVKHLQFGPDGFDWGEGFARARGFYGFGQGAYVTAGGVVMTTRNTDYFGVKDENDGLLDQLALVVPNLGESGFGFSIGRQPIVLGDGFLVGDGYYDRRAALWNIPLGFYDGATAHFARGPHTFTAAVTDFSPSFAGPDVETQGLIVAGEYSLKPKEGQELALTFVRADVDFDDANSTPYAFSVRGKHATGPWSFGTEIVFEGGQMDGADLAGKGGHAEVMWQGEGRLKPSVKLQGFWFSGDDPDTEENEGYYPWQYTWSDWSNWYVGDLLASTVGTASNMRIVMAQFGCEPREGTKFRLLAHKFDRVEAADTPFAVELDAVVDQDFGHGLSGYVMGAWAKAGDEGEAEFAAGDAEASMQLFVAVTWKFSGKLAK
ncbi:MAG: hypothetical protein U0704_05085 [Candidatus Eisenbacteria bacterium]